MGPKRRAAARQVVEHEFEAARLKTAWQRERLKRIAGAMATRPDKGLPQVLRDPSQLEGGYRFFANEGVKASELFAAHAERTKDRAQQSTRVVIAHDTTDFTFGGERRELSRLSGNARGFLGHFALAIDGATSMPLGVVHVESVVREEKPKRRKGAPAGDDTNEALRWHRGAAATYASYPAAVNVMDREADSYPLLHDMVERGQDFVVRVSYRERRTDGGPVGAVAAQAAAAVEREVLLSDRKLPAGSKQRRRFGARRSRLAKLDVSACAAVDLLRPITAGVEHASRFVVNVVRVVEPRPPKDEQPVEWLLYTSLPVDTPEQMLAVVDAYRQRWLIEELFKAIKTGCAFERRQLENVEALLKVLAISLPIAWQMLRLRTMARLAPDAPASSVLTATQMICLRHELPRALPPKPTARDALLAVAQLGGHLRNNGDPGWLTIRRGLDELIPLERGYLMARQGDQS